ncbi:MAG: motif, partial [Pseudomonadota bacterium]
DTRGELRVTRVRYLVGQVPEPATWAMLLIGFGATGAALRRRRKAVFATGF